MILTWVLKLKLIGITFLCLNIIRIHICIFAMVHNIVLRTVLAIGSG